MILYNAEFKKQLMSQFSCLHHCQAGRSRRKNTDCYQLDNTGFLYNATEDIFRNK